MAVASMDHRGIHRGIDAVLKDMRQHPEDAKVQDPFLPFFTTGHHHHRGIHRGIDAVLKDMRQHPVAVVSTVLVIVFVGIRLLLHCRHEEGDKSRCRDYYAASCVALRCACALTLTIANCAHNHKHTGVAGCHGRGVYGSSWD